MGRNWTVTKNSDVQRVGLNTADNMSRKGEKRGVSRAK